MKIHNLPVIKYSYDALEPIISAETLRYHHDKHHQGYVDQLNKLVPGSGFETATLEAIVRNATGPIFEQAAQHWNHSFYWNSINPAKEPLKENGALGTAISKAFGSKADLKTEFEKVGKNLFGSGWLWLVSDSNGELSLLATKDAMNPMREQSTAILACDLWEHSYYIDYRNLRAKYLAGIFEVLDWSFAESNYLNVGVGKLGLQMPNAELFSR